MRNQNYNIIQWFCFQNKIVVSKYFFVLQEFKIRCSGNCKHVDNNYIFVTFDNWFDNSELQNNI